MKEILLKLESAFASIPTSIKTQYKDLIEHYHVARHKIKDLGKTNYELGLFHIHKGNMVDAIMRFKLSLKFKDGFALAHYHLARCYLFSLKLDKAKQELETALALDPSLEIAKYRMALINHNLKDHAVLIEVVKEDYECLALTYDENMLQASYSAPNLLTQAIKKHLGTSKSLKYLDIGCGTGLVGEGLVEQGVTIKSLIGIDISTNMLELAKTLVINNIPIYNELKEIDAQNIDLIDDHFDIALACMSLGYINDLMDFFKKISSITKKGAVFGLIVLKSSELDVEFNYDHACLSFSQDFLNKVFQKTKWSIEQQEEIDVLNNNVKAWMIILVKK